VIEWLDCRLRRRESEVEGLQVKDAAGESGGVGIQRGSKAVVDSSVFYVSNLPLIT
jgi:hypothetical protein